MRPSQLLDAQLDLINRLEHNPVFQELQVGSVGQVVRHKDETNDQFWRRIRNGRLTADERWITQLPAVTARAVRNASVYEVSPELTDVLTWTAATLRETDPFTERIAPTPWGLVHFEKPVKLADVEGKTLHMDWLLWFPIRLEDDLNGTAMLVYNDMAAPDDVTRMFLDDTPEDLIRAMGRWVYTTFNVASEGERLGPVRRDDRLESDGAGVSLMVHPTTNLQRLVYGLWFLLTQTITKADVEHPDRHGQRRAERARIPPRVTVIRLRHVKPPVEGDHKAVNWQHHWIVRGHPRWQACGPGYSERRLIWVNAFVKGDLSKPLVQSEKIYRLDR